MNTINKIVAAALLLTGVAALAAAQPSTTKPPLTTMTVSACTNNFPILGAGATTEPKCAPVAYLTGVATSGGIPYFSSTTQIASSGLLAANQIVLGGGTATTPATLGSLGSTTTVLHGNAAGAPTFGAVAVSTDISGLGTGVATALSTNIGTAGSFVVNGGALGSPSSAGTIPAFTLGGTIAGGGNQINNVIIGTTTPLAGSFTTANASTSVTSPIVAGGTTASSTLTLESTSGAGTTDNISFKTGSQAFAGGINTSQQWTMGANQTPISGPILTINKNTGAPASASSATLLHLIGANTIQPIVLVDSFTSSGSGSPFIATRSGEGTAASFTATLNGGALGFFGMVGSTSANTFAGITSAGGAFFGARATENWSTTAQGTKIQIYTTPNTTASLIEAVIVNQSGGLGIGASAADPGIGGLQVTGQQFNPSMASDTATADSTVCTATTGGKLLKGTGALGICLGTSGRQFKTNFAPMQAGIDELMRISMWNYDYILGHGDSGVRRQYGPTAQDVEAILPDLVGHNPEGEAINYDSGSLIFIGLHAIQQLKLENNELRQEIENIKRGMKMPSTTAKQARTMAAAAHNPKFAKKVGIPPKVAKDFNRADTKKKRRSPAQTLFGKDDR